MIYPQVQSVLSWKSENILIKPCTNLSFDQFRSFKKDIHKNMGQKYENFDFKNLKEFVNKNHIYLIGLDRLWICEILQILLSKLNLSTFGKLYPKIFWFKKFK